MREIDSVINSLSKSAFRSRFHLKESDIKYIEEKGMDKIKEHAYNFINKKLKVKQANDGKQTPYHGHPVFIAEHATATCCRGCVNKWYKIPEYKELSEEEVDYLVSIIMKWLEKELLNWKK